MNPSPTVSESQSFACDQPIPTTPGERWRSGMTVLPDVMIERELGWGGMGVVYLATQRITGQPLALKRLAAAQSAPNDEVRRRLYRELTSWLNLPPHPNIVPCLFFRTLETGELVIFSPFISGGTVEEWISDQRARPLQAALDIGRQIADGLAAVHSHGMLHQDLKPANVLMSSEGIARITDFGLTRGVHDKRGRSGYTVAYASPEQIDGAELTPATDVYSWAAIMAHVLLTERTWSTGPELAGAWSSLAATAGVVDEVATLIGMCLDANPARRPTSSAIANQLRELAQREFGTARPGVVASSASEASTIHQFQLESLAAFGRMMIGPPYWHLKADAMGIEVGPLDEPELKTTRANLAQDIAELARLVELFNAAGRQRPEVRPWCIRLLVEFSVAQTEAGDFNGAIQAARRAVELCVQTLEASPEDRASAQLAGARALIAAGQRDEAIHELEGVPALLANRGMAANVLIQVANLQADLHELDVAIGTYEQARALLREREPGVLRDFDLARIEGELALIHRRTNHLDAALQCIDAALAIYERMSRAIETLSVPVGQSLYLKGTIFTDAQRHDEAISCYDRAIEVFSAAPAGIQLAPQIESARMSRALSLRQIGRLDEAIRDLDRVIAKRKEWVEGLGLIDYSVDLARAYINKANALGQKGDRRGQIEAKLKAYGLLSELSNKFQRKEIRPELCLVAGSLGEDFMRMGDRESARQLFRASTALLEMICQDAAMSATALLPKYEAQLVSKYYQLSYLCDDDVKEHLLDLCLGLGCRLMKTGADAEICDRVVAALTDKSLLLSERGDKTRAQELLRDAEDIGVTLIRSSPQWQKYVNSFLRSASVRATLLLEANQRESCRIYSAALAEIHGKGPIAFEPGVADLIATTWIGKAKAQRGLEDVDDVVRSYSRGAALWEEAIARKHYNSTWAYSQFACDHANWLISQGQSPLARKAITSMIDTFQRVALEADSPEADTAVAHYREVYRSVLDAGCHDG